MIKKIQLRGISRTPGNRITEDGGCSESINVELREGELCPAINPSDITGDLLGLSPYKDIYKVVFIHKNAGYEHYVTVATVTDSDEQQKESIRFYANHSWSSSHLLEVGEQINDIKAVGNTVIVATNLKKRHFLYEASSYTALGDNPPRPNISLYATLNHSSEGYLSVEAFRHEMNYDTGTQLSTKTLFDRAKQWIHQSASSWSQDEKARAYLSDLATAIQNACIRSANAALEDDCIPGPVLARAALRLYDGSYIYATQPILLFAYWVNSSYRISGKNLKIDSQSETWFSQNVRVVLTNAFFARYKIDVEDNRFAPWKDIVRSIDIFLSPCIDNPLNTAEVTGVADMEYPYTKPYPIPSWMIDGDEPTSDDGIFYFNGMDPDGDAESFKSKMLEQGNFYLVESIEIDDFIQTVHLDKKISPKPQDELVVQSRLTDSRLSSISPIGKMAEYNSRLMFLGIKETYLPLSSDGFSAVSGTVPDETKTTFSKIIFYIKDDAGDTRNVYAAENLQEYFHAVRGYIAYPNSRCIRAEVYINNTCYSLPMKEHPLLDCAYGFWGLDQCLFQTSTTKTAPAEDNVSVMRETLAMSEAANPFIFPYTLRHRFLSPIISVATTTQALSQGQFGQFPLYAFTEDGISAASIDANGEIESVAPLSRDVAIPGTVCPIEQAIVFVTESAVKILRGSEIEDISENMNGSPYSIPASISGLLENTVWSRIANSETVPFMGFVKNAKAAYDYKGQRLIFFNSTQRNMQYVYSLKDGTWHRLYVYDEDGAGFFASNILNSYPDCYISGNYLSAEGKSVVYNFSTPRDVTSANIDALPGMVISRPLSLGAEDLRKTIRHLEVRGDYIKGQVQSHLNYIVLGSDNGVDFVVLHSLRGPSWKFYRIVVLSNLSADERISFVEIDYETRFSDKIR